MFTVFRRFTVLFISFVVSFMLLPVTVIAENTGSITVTNTIKKEQYHLIRVFEMSGSGSHTAPTYRKHGETDPFLIALQSDTSPFILSQIMDTDEYIEQEARKRYNLLGDREIRFVLGTENSDNTEKLLQGIKPETEKYDDVGDDTLEQPVPTAAPAGGN